MLFRSTSAGTDTGPFDLFSNVDGYIIPIDGAISRAALLAGYTCTTVPDTATSIRVKSLAACKNYVDLAISFPTTTTTTSTSTSTTTSTTTVAPPITTTTTTTAAPVTTTTTTTSGGGTTTTTTTSGGGGTTTTTTTTAAPATTTTTTTAGPAPTTTTTTTPTPNYAFYFEIVNGNNDFTLALNTEPGVPTTTTNYTLVKSGVSTYNPSSDTVTRTGGSAVIQKIEKIDYDGVTVLYTATPGTPNYTFGTGPFTMNSNGVAPGDYQTIRITIL